MRAELPGHEAVELLRLAVASTAAKRPGELPATGNGARGRLRR